jgi:uncharacterized protein YjbI with pentapeptide repeats
MSRVFCATLFLCAGAVVSSTAQSPDPAFEKVRAAREDVAGTTCVVGNWHPGEFIQIICRDTKVDGALFGRWAARADYMLRFDNTTVGTVSVPQLAAQARMNGVTFESIETESGSSQTTQKFHGCTFSGSTKLMGVDTTFTYLEMRACMFNDGASFSATFDGRTSFADSRFARPAIFLESHFKGPVSFAGVHSASKFIIDGKLLDPAEHTQLSEVSFYAAELRGLVEIRQVLFGESDFTDATLDNALFEECRFDKPPLLKRTTFTGRLSFYGSTFVEGLDIREADLSNVQTVVLDRINIVPERLKFRWEQLKASAAGPRIALTEDYKLARAAGRLKVVEQRPDEQAAHLRVIYHLLIAALVAEGREEDADDARYELALRERQLLGGTQRALYGAFFGYGYKPWRVLWLALPLIAVFAAGFAFHYPEVAAIMNADVREGHIAPTDIHKIAKFLQVIVFSTSVLLGIRFKQEWIPARAPLFTLVVVAEWLTGITLYVLFVALVRTAGFAYVKGLLGF